MSDALECRVLGSFTVTRGAEPLLLRAALQRRLLATLLSESGRSVSVDALIDTIWDGSPPANANSSLLVSIHRLRRALGEPPRIDRDPSGYRIRVSAAEFDAKAFDERSTAARRARSAGRLDQAADSFADAARLWRGEPYADLPQTGLIAREANRLSEERVLVQQELLEVQLDLGGHDALIGDIEALARDHPYRERLTALRMLALYRAGRQAEALGVYRESRRILREEMGIDPGTLLQRVHEAILRRDERLDHLATESLDGAWEPAARHRLESAAPTRPTPRELPPDVIGFTGRQAELSELDAARLGDEPEGIPPSPVIVIAGMGGVGKTSTAVHWAHRIAGDYPDGQLFVNLRGFSGGAPLRPIEALAVMLRSLGLDSDRIPADPDEAAALLRTETAGKRLLVVLDNAAGAEQVVPLLPGEAQSLVIATSRHQLGDLLAQHGGYLLRLAPLAPGEAGRLLKTLLRTPRSADRPEIDALAERCGYLPLALRIAAASLTDQPHLDLGEYTERLASGGQVSALRIGDNPATAVKATFDRSYTALPEQVRAVFRLLGIAPVRSLAAEAVAVMADASMSVTERAVEHLVAAHMINRDGRGRFSLHDLIRDYANELIGADDPERLGALERLFDWYLETAAAASAHRHPGHARLIDPPRADRPLSEADAERAARWLEDERENLIALARYTSDNGEGAVAWRLADILRSHAWAELSGADFLALGYAALKGAKETGSLEGEAVAELGLSTAYLKVRDFAAVVPRAERAIALAERIGWDSGRASAHHNMMFACWQLGRLRESVRHGQAALAMNRAGGRLRAQSVNLGALAIVYGALGELRREAELHAEALELAERVGSTGLCLTHLWGMVSVSIDLGRVELAERHLERIRAIEAEAGENEVGTDETVSVLHRALGRFDAALRHAESVVRYAEERGDKRIRAAGSINAAAALNGLGRHREAIEAAGRALEAAGEELAGARIEALVQRAVGRIELGETETAGADAALALELARAGGYRIGEAMALNLTGEAVLRGGAEPTERAAQARDPVRRALEVFRSAGHRPGESWSLWLLGLAARAVGDESAARRHWEASRRICDDSGVPVPPRFAMDL